MRAWIDVMRHLEPIMADYERIFDAWASGGVDGLVMGPLAFEDKSFTFDPNPEVYRRFSAPAGEHPGFALVETSRH